MAIEWIQKTKKLIYSGNFRLYVKWHVFSFFCFVLVKFNGEHVLIHQREIKKILYSLLDHHNSLILCLQDVELLQIC